MFVEVPQQPRGEQEVVYRLAGITQATRPTRDEDGYYWFIGRDDDVNQGVGLPDRSPSKVESAFIEHPAVQEAAGRWGLRRYPGDDREGVRDLKVRSPAIRGARQGTPEPLSKRVTAPYKYPRVIEFVDSLPKTISGKIRRYRAPRAGTQKIHERAEALTVLACQGGLTRRPARTPLYSQTPIFSRTFITPCT